MNKKSFKKGDLVYHGLFEEDRGVVVEEITDTDYPFHYRVWWAADGESVEPSRDIQLVENKENQ